VRVWNKLALGALIVACSSTSSFAQQNAPAAGAATSQTKVAVIDVGFIVKNHPSVKQQQTMIRNQVKATQEELVKRRDAWVKEAEKLKDLREGGPEFNALQEKLAREEAQLKLDSVRKDKEFDEIGSKMALEFYNKLQVVIAQHADFFGLDVVLQCNRDQPDEKQPASIQMALEKEVVYFRPTIDLTDHVLKALTEESAAPAASPAQTPGAVPRAAANPGRTTR
jgi:Skp family chaperone for outer membrane proteins